MRVMYIKIRSFYRNKVMVRYKEYTKINENNYKNFLRDDGNTFKNVILLN